MSLVDLTDASETRQQAPLASAPWQPSCFLYVTAVSQAAAERVMTFAGDFGAVFAAISMVLQHLATSSQPTMGGLDVRIGLDRERLHTSAALAQLPVAHAAMWA